jgi:hypothetical protein
MLMVTAGGLVLLALFLGAGRLRGGASTATTMAKVFIPVWLVAALVNMYVGVTRAGYTIAQETPILVVIFGVPAAIAWLIARSRAVRE